ncbi:hypothetical protein [Arthrobacter cavernae]|uniref:Uncharacterized protein n=1 Tax=Arthrobacter cavernae TaxID=2817681 RepID=A0A939HJR5_9MICC|nr:hypothetical protein [Arthrobacter cavernae]MBO1269111.1 hypothetical protein [Arthrobacter cavernae]
MAYADGFWMISLRGAVGAIERTQGPFASWLRESTAALPVFVFGVLAALALALRWFGPVPSKPRTVMATGLLVAAAGTLAGTAEIAASSAWDYHLQLQLMDSSDRGSTGTAPSSLEQATLGLQLRAIGYGSGILFITNLVLIGWAVAIRGGRLTVSRTQPRTARGRQLGQAQLFLVTALFGSAAIHAAVVPEHLGEWAAAGAFFLVLSAAQFAAGLLVLRRRQRTVLPARTALLATAAVSIIPLALWLYSRTAGLPFGPGAGVPEPLGLPDSAAGALELGTLVLAMVLLRGRGRLPGRPPASAHIRALPVVAAIAVGVIGLAGTGAAWFDNPGRFGHESETISHYQMGIESTRS